MVIMNNLEELVLHGKDLTIIEFYLDRPSTLTKKKETMDKCDPAVLL